MNALRDVFSMYSEGSRTLSGIMNDCVVAVPVVQFGYGCWFVWIPVNVSPAFVFARISWILSVWKSLVRTIFKDEVVTVAGLVSSRPVETTIFRL